jgi:hypothetical protein
MPDSLTLEQRMTALLDAELDVRERQRRPTEAHPTTPRHDPATPWTVAEIAERLERSRVFVERALLALYARQTSTEQTAHATQEENGVGFNRIDASFLTSLAQQVQANAANPRSQYHREGRRLSDRQLAAARKCLRKYVGQLCHHANRNRHA